MNAVDKKIFTESSSSSLEYLCSYPKIVGMVLISKYMSKKYGFEKAFEKVIARKHYKYIIPCGN